MIFSRNYEFIYIETLIINSIHIGNDIARHVVSYLLYFEFATVFLEQR